MKSRRRLWIGCGALCALAILVGWLARPEDELAGMMKLNPDIEKAYYPLGWPASMRYSSYLFHDPAPLVLIALPGSKTASVGSDIPYWRIVLPSGRQAELVAWDAGSCTLELDDDNRPWYKRAWSTIKHRLGL